MEMIGNTGSGLCPACRYIGRWGFLIGAILAGLVVKLLGLLT